MKRSQIYTIIAFTTFLLLFCSCGKGAGKAPVADVPSVEELKIMHEPEFGGVYIKIAIDEFNALGFQYGNSVRVAFSNGYILEDIPYYNGYYTKTGEPLLIAYPGYEYIKAAINNGDDLWTVANLSEEITADITLNDPDTYRGIQEARDLHYEDDRSLFTSDEEFANFRSISMNAVRENTLYRAASPCDDQHNRASYTDELIKNVGVRFILNLADDENKIKDYMNGDGFNSPYFAGLYEAGNVMPVALNMNIGSQEFKERIAQGLTAMAEAEGPYLVHCTEGKDRTGFVCMLLEALAGADYESMEKDYMITYANYYHITEEKDPDRYRIIVEDVFIPLIQSMAGDETLDVRNADLQAYAEAFLHEAGMEKETIEKLKTVIDSKTKAA